MHLSTADRALYIKLVYYGPGLSGKTTNLETLHRLTDPRKRQPMVSLRTEGDRTLFFDLLPFDLGKLYGLDLRVKLFTVPGQVQYDTTRKQVLAGADGVVFVADSGPTHREQNVVMLRYLRSNLEANGLDAETVPLVMQWNKRDLPDAMPADQMEQDLNWRRVPALGAVATRGDGVLETFQEITAVTLEQLSRKAPALAGRLQPGEVRANVNAAFAGLIVTAKKATAFTPSAPIGRVIATGARAADEQKAEPGAEHIGLDELLSEAVQTNLALSERLVAGASREQLVGRNRRERQSALGLCRLIHSAPDADSLLRCALRAALAGLEIPIGSILQSAGPKAPLREIAVAGRPGDPLNSVLTPGIGSVATALLERGEVVTSGDLAGELLFGQRHPAVANLRSLLSIPIEVERAGGTLMLLYGDASSRDFDDDDAEFATLIAAIAGVALRGLTVSR